MRKQKVFYLLLAFLIIFNVNVFAANPNSENAVYLNPANGDDSLDGLSHNSPVKSFDRAKDIASSNLDIESIYIMSTLDLASGDLTLEGTNAVLKRHPDHKSYLLRVSGSDKDVTLKNIIIDGNSENVEDIQNSIIKVGDGATLNISQGSVLRNNKIKNRLDNYTTGGAIDASKSLVNMSDGIVEDNVANWGGGIYLSDSTLNFTGGTIQNNLAKLYYDNNIRQYYSAGGGIIAYNGSTINMSTDAKVLNNRADENGGGISVGGNDWSNTNILNMDGGLVDANVAGSSGGGIFIQAKMFGGGKSKAYISAGRITNNLMDDSGHTANMFGGGGIYVNGTPREYTYGGYTFQNGGNGELHLSNAIITDNEAKLFGGGYAACPISFTNMHVTNGIAIYGNRTEKDKAKDIYILSSQSLGLHSGIPEYKISDRMLGGKLYNWKKDDGQLLAPEDHQGRLEGEMESLSLHTDEVGNEFTVELATVIIAGNKSATRGGGIGSNGTLITGKEEYTKIFAKKEWQDNNNSEGKRPQEIEVELYSKLAGTDQEARLVGTEKIKPDANGNWEYVFENLPKHNADGIEFEYSIKERPVVNYTSELSIDQNSLDKTYIIKNTYIPEIEIPVEYNISVKKIWDDSNNKDGFRPDYITVRLFADGQEVNSKKISQANNWRWTFKGLDKYKDGQEIKYTISEEPVPGYTSKINLDNPSGSEWTIKNSRTHEFVSVSGVKTWDDNNNQDGLRPEEITVRLYSDGKEINSAKVNKDKNWSWEFKKLPKYNDQGAEIVYTVKEDPVEGYTSKIDGYNITNIHVPGKINVNVAKKWDDNNNQAGKRPESVTIKLLANGQETGQDLILNSANGWSGAFNDLDAYKGGQKIVYTLVEVGVEGYESEVTGDQVKGFIVKNSLKPVHGNPPTNDGTPILLYLGIVILAIVIFIFVKNKKK